MSSYSSKLEASDESSGAKLLSNDNELESQQSYSYSRAHTFTRNLTFDLNFLKRTVTQTFGVDPDSEEAWTKGLLEEYYKAASSGVEGDIPIPAAFATNYEFWKAFLLASVNGIFIGFAALGYLNFADRVRLLIFVFKYYIIKFICNLIF